MPSSIAHASVAILLSPMLGATRVSRPLLVTAAVLATAPDFDAIGRPFGWGDVAILGGHRAVTHSVFFALAVGATILAFVNRKDSACDRWLVAGYVTAVVLSHGILDAFTTYGDGVAFFAPVSMRRWKSSWQPLSGILPEVVAVWLPAFLFYQAWLKARIMRQRSSVRGQ